MRCMSIQTIAIPRVAYPIPEFAVLVGISPSTVYRMAARGELELVRFGRRQFVPAAQLQKLRSRESDCSEERAA